jgi:hypothetical protein
MMAKERMVGFHAAICFIFCTLLCNACAGGPGVVGGQGTQQLVVTEYLLKDAGFQRWDVNLETPGRQALLNSIPRRKIVTYQADGKVYHVYADEKSQVLYVGDAAAYQKYLSLAKDKQLCERVDATNSAPFWSCFDESQKGRGGRR